MIMIQIIDNNQVIAYIVRSVTACYSVWPGLRAPATLLDDAQNLPQHVLPQYRSALAAALRRR